MSAEVGEARLTLHVVHGSQHPRGTARAAMGAVASGRSCWQSLVPLFSRARQCWPACPPARQPPKAHAHRCASGHRRLLAPFFVVAATLLHPQAVLNAEAQVDKGENARMASFVGAIAVAGEFQPAALTARLNQPRLGGWLCVADAQPFASRCVAIHEPRTRSLPSP